MTALEVIYEQGKASWHPQPDDNPDNYWFYRAWHGVTCVCETLGYDAWDYNHIVHQALCWSTNGEWSIFVEQVQRLADVPVPKKPSRSSTSWDSKPDFDDKRPYEIFRQQFKQKYPDKRMNSRFAQEAWERVEHAAIGIAQEELATKMRAWEARERDRETVYQKQVAEWQLACDIITKNQQFAAQLTKDNDNACCL